MWTDCVIDRDQIKLYEKIRWFYHDRIDEKVCLCALAKVLHMKKKERRKSTKKEIFFFGYMPNDKTCDQRSYAIHFLSSFHLFEYTF